MPKAMVILKIRPAQWPFNPQITADLLCSQGVQRTCQMGNSKEEGSSEEPHLPMI